MTGRTALFCFPILFAAWGVARADDASAGRIAIDAWPAVVTVTGLPPGRYFIDLPALEYAFEITADCANDALPQSLSVNVADTRVTLSREEFEEAPAQHVLLEVPASQTAPLAVDDFCAVEPAEAAEARTGPSAMPFAPARGKREPLLLEIPHVLSAQISLVCSDGQERTMAWASQPLGVTLACAMPARSPAGPPAPAPGPAEP